MIHISLFSGLKRHQGYHHKETKNEDLELPLFDLATIIRATNNFAINNKLGEGGFGPVYKVRFNISNHDEFWDVELYRNHLDPTVVESQLIAA